MKRTVAAVIAAVMLVLMLPASAVHQPDNTETVWQNSDELVVCFDTLIFGMPEGYESMTTRYNVSDGGAAGVVSTHPITIDREETLVCRGWAGIKSSAKITRYGYRINGGDPVFDDSFKYDCEQAVINAGGDSRFHVTIPVKGLTDPTLLTVTCMGTDNVVRDVLEFSVNGEYLTGDYHPLSPFERTYENTESDKLNVVIEGGAEAKTARAGETVQLDVRFYNMKSVKTAELVLSYDPDLRLSDTEFPIKTNGDTATATVDAKTHTVTLYWNSTKAYTGNKTFATLTFETAGDVSEKDFLHVTAKSFSGASVYKLINGGVEILYDIGDINGDGFVNNKDVVALFRSCSGDDTYKKASLNVRDVNRDGSSNNKDVIKLFRVTSDSDVIESAGYIETKYDEKTARVTNVRSWTFNDGFAGTVIGVYCETEPDSDVIVCDYDGKVLLREKTLDRYFFGRYILPAGKSSETVYIYAKTEGKGWSVSSRPLTLEYGGGGGNALIAHDSHVFYNQYNAHYRGDAVIPGDAQNRMTQVRGYLTAQLNKIRQATGKKTKIIIVVCANPATVYHDVQYTEEEGGWGDHYTETSYTQFAEFMKDNEDIYVLDMRDLFEENKDKLLFMQADSHWTSLAAYYAYYRAAEKVKGDFPQINVYDLDRDFDVSVVRGGGDLLNFMAAYGASAATTSVSWKSEDMKAPSNAPTAYVMGDSYYGAIRGYLDLMFSTIYLNNPPTNPPLYDYTLDDIKTKKPDYLFYVWTERNIDNNLNMIVNCVNAGNIR